LIESGAAEGGIRLERDHGTLRNNRRVVRQFQAFRKGRAGGVHDAMPRPGAAVGVKRGVVRRMPVTRSINRKPFPRKALKITVEDRHDFIAVGHSQRSTGQEVRLDIHDQQRVSGTKVFGIDHRFSSGLGRIDELQINLSALGFIQLRTGCPFARILWPAIDPDVSWAAAHG
jgi:hypothetical protein